MHLMAKRIVVTGTVLAFLVILTIFSLLSMSHVSGSHLNHMIGEGPPDIHVIAEGPPDIHVIAEGPPDIHVIAEGPGDIPTT